MKFDGQEIRKHALKWDESIFKSKIKKFIDEKMKIREESGKA